MQTRFSSYNLRIGKSIVGLIVATTLVVFLFSSMLAADIPVTTTADELTNNGKCSLREAIQAANSRAAVDVCPAGDGDDTVLLPAGTFTLMLPGAGEDNNQSGDFDISGTLNIIGLGPALTIIDGNQLDRVIHVHISATTTISGVTIVNGHAPDGVGAVNADGTEGEDGGAIHNRGNLAIVNSKLHANQAGNGGIAAGSASTSTITGGDGGSGGAIFNASSLHVDHCALLDNHAGDGGTYDGSSDHGGNGGDGGNGGAIFNDGSMSVTASTFRANRTGYLGGSPGLFAADGHGGYGGGIANLGVMNVTLGRVENNAAYSGGGLYNIGETTTISITIAENHNWAEGGRWHPPGGSGGTSGPGGGIFNSGQLDMSYSAVVNNHTADGGDFGGGSHSRGGSSGAGGGLFSGGVLTLTQSTVSGNQTGDGGSSTWGGNSGNGGGIANSGDLTLDNATVFKNTVGRGGVGAFGDGVTGIGGGIYNEEGKATSVHNSIMASNYVTSTVNNCAGTLSSLDYNLLQNPAGCVLTGPIAQTLIGVDPQILPLGDHGGPTPTNGIGFFSPAVDAGACTDINGAQIAVDQRGIARPVGSGCDIGAIEVLPPTSFVYLPAAIHQ